MLILEYDSTEIVPGGAGNAANNVAALGGRPVVVGLVGRDEAGRGCWRRSRQRRRAPAWSRPRGYRTPIKTRILAGGIHSAKQQVVRIDRGRARSRSDAASRRRCERKLLRARVRRCDAVLVSDYGSGLVTPALVAARARNALRPSGAPPVLVDSRYALLDYRGLTACTPNESEVEQLLGVRIDDNAARARARRPRAARADARSQAVLDHPRQPRHGAVRARRADRPHPDLRLRPDRRRHRRRRHRHRDDDAGAGRRARRSRRRRGWPTTPAASW